METTNLYTPLIRNSLKQYITNWIYNAAILNKRGQFEFLDCSYEDFHAPGANYLCLFRSPSLTIKLYELPPTNNKPIVACHDHAYDFDTLLLDGRFANYTYREHDEDERDSYDLIRYKREFKSKLNGGNGFDEQCERVALGLRHGVWFDRKYDHYFCSIKDIHTLYVAEPTLLFLSQYEDKKTVTSVYTETPEAPSMDGLYKKMRKEKAQEMLTKALNLL